MIRALSLALTAALLTGPAHAESHLLNAEALAALVDQRVNALSPYETLLNDPDPARSAAAMEIMLASGDQSLVRSAVSFGFQASNPELRMIAARHVLDTGVPITLALSGVSEDGLANFAKWTRYYLDAAVSPEGTAYVTIDVGPFDAEKGCYQMANQTSGCAVSLNSDGIFVKVPHLNARLGFADGATLSGAASVEKIDDPLKAELHLSH
ncbi:hypothetical protein [Primorskyibacter sp. S187A]|uniref:hypothetical protein n=1 Tax=Primorskyibacter sp. S187A TaxID=3415130 RepID=UPI003C7B86C5